MIWRCKSARVHNNLPASCITLIDDVADLDPKSELRKWDKSGTFSDQNSIHFSSASHNVLKSDLKTVAQSDPSDELFDSAFSTRFSVLLL